MGKSKKNGWFIRERTDPKTGNVRPMSIRYQNGEEVEHHWLDVEVAQQSEWGAIVDANSENRMTLRKEELNQKYAKRFKSQVDYPGEDTKLEKSSSTYKEKLDKYRNSSSYKKRYSKNEIHSVQCKAETSESVRCQNITTDPSGFCHIHLQLPDVEKGVRCQAKNRDGTRCLNATINENGFCSIHQDQVPVISDRKQKLEAEFIESVQNNDNYWNGSLVGYEREDYLRELAVKYDFNAEDIPRLKEKIKTDRAEFLAEKLRKDIDVAMKDPETKKVVDYLEARQKDDALLLDSNHTGVYEKIGRDGDSLIVKQVIATSEYKDGKFVPHQIISERPIKLNAYEVDEKGAKDLSFEALSTGIYKKEVSYDISPTPTAKKPISHLTYLKRQRTLFEAIK